MRCNDKNCSTHKNSCNDIHYRAKADYIIIGAGAAGCVVASRLALAKKHVLVLEAGPDVSPDTQQVGVQSDAALVNGPPIPRLNLINVFRRVANTPSCSNNFRPSATLLNFRSIDQDGAYYNYPRGAGSGGSTNHYFSQDGIGPMEIYDNIGETVGNTQIWNANHIYQITQNMQTVNPGWTPPPPPGTPLGGNGWLQIRDDYFWQLSQDILDSAVDKGIPFNSNFYENDDNSGVGNSTQATAGPAGGISNSFVSLLYPLLKQNNKYVKIRYNVTVDKILFEKKCGLYKAKYVLAYDKPFIQFATPGLATIEGSPPNCVAKSPNKDLPLPSKYKACKEIIVSGGAVQTPTILMRSGIGPRGHLESLGIRVLLDKPGVGSNLLDHTEFGLSYKFDTLKYIHPWQAAILTPGIGYPPDWVWTTPGVQEAITANADPTQLATLISGLQIEYNTGTPYNGQPLGFHDTHSVFYAAFQTSYGYYQNPDQPLYLDNPWTNELDRRWPDIQVVGGNPPLGTNNKWELEALQFPTDPAAIPAVYGHFLIESLVPKVTNGTIRLPSTDPRDIPIIREQLYEDDGPEGSLIRIARAILKIREIMEDPAIKNKYGLEEINPGPLNATEEQLVEFVKKWSVYGHHMSGTCKMGKPDDPMAVCDPEMKVYGTSNLRICDTSVYPTPWLHGYNTSRGAYIVGEVLSEILNM